MTFVQCIIKQLLDLFFVINIIIKVSTLIILNIAKPSSNKQNQINFIFCVSTFKVGVLKFTLSSPPGNDTPLFPVAVLILILDVLYGTGREKIN